jgi:hypothetical protein
MSPSYVRWNGLFAISILVSALSACTGPDTGDCSATATCRDDNADASASYAADAPSPETGPAADATIDRTNAAVETGATSDTGPTTEARGQPGRGRGRMRQQRRLRTGHRVRRKRRVRAGLHADARLPRNRGVLRIGVRRHENRFGELRQMRHRVQGGERHGQMRSGRVRDRHLLDGPHRLQRLV